MRVIKRFSRLGFWLPPLINLKHLIAPVIAVWVHYILLPKRIWVFLAIAQCLLHTSKESIKDRGGEPILQMTCRDRNRIALQAELLLAYTREIRNILCLTGDAVVVGDHKEAKGVFDLDSVQLLKAIRQWNQART
jgi:hypothetical protein